MLIAAGTRLITAEDIGEFYWPAGLSDAQAVFRRSSDNESIRPADEISLVELAALANELRAKGRLGDDLLYAMSRELGFQKLTASSRARLQKAVSLAADQ
jgi:hypothetical protein